MLQEATDQTHLITLQDVILHLRERFINAVSSKDEAEILAVNSALRAIEATIETLHSSKQVVPILIPIEHLMAAIGDYFHGETWKSTIPTIEEIKAAFSNQ